MFASPHRFVPRGLPGRPPVRLPRTGLLAACLAVAVTACQAPKTTAVPAFREGVATANQHSAAVFSDINKLLREQQLDRAAEAASLSEDLFAEGLPRESLATWNRAFAAIEAYAGKIEELLGPDHREGIEDELRDLGAQYESASGDELPPGLAASFTQLGGLLVELRANTKALEVMRETDPAVRDIFETMALAIGSSSDEGVRLTVWSAWTTNLGRLQLAFLGAETPEQKRAIAEDFLSMMGDREANDLALATLRRSILALQNAHSDMAKGEQVGATALISIVQGEYESWKEEKERQEQGEE